MRNGVRKTDKMKLFEVLKDPFDKGRLKWILLAAAAILGVVLMALGGENGLEETVSYVNGASFEESMELKIKNICEKVKGAGETSVAVTLGDGEKRAVSAGVFSGDEVLYSEICGIGIVCEGGDDPQTVRELLELVSATCGVPTSRIYVATSEKSTVYES